MDYDKSQQEILIILIKNGAGIIKISAPSFNSRPILG
jgi:hypothetical protein